MRERSPSPGPIKSITVLARTPIYSFAKPHLLTGRVEASELPSRLNAPIFLIGERERANLDVQLARFLSGRCTYRNVLDIRFFTCAKCACAFSPALVRTNRFTGLSPHQPRPATEQQQRLALVLLRAHSRGNDARHLAAHPSTVRACAAAKMYDI